MTRDKAQKRAIRERMAKTGERYTTARHFHLDLHNDRQSESAVPAVAGNEATMFAVQDQAALPPRVAEPGMSDESVLRGTGKTWDEWFVLLDGWEAARREHPEIARHLHDAHGIDGWWAQTVTVGYERARGMRAVHERPDGFSVNASKTFPVPVEQLFAAFVDDAMRDRWLGPGELRLRTNQPNRSARFDVLANDTRLAAWFTAKGPEKSSVQLQHERLPTADEIDGWRAHWKASLTRLAGVLREWCPDSALGSTELPPS
jgi:hypothetical protein